MYLEENKENILKMLNFFVRFLNNKIVLIMVITPDSLYTKKLVCIMESSLDLLSRLKFGLNFNKIFFSFK